MKTSKMNSNIFALITLLFLIAPNTNLLGVVAKINNAAEISTAKKASKISKLKKKIKRKVDRFKKKIAQHKHADKSKNVNAATVIFVVLLAVLLLLLLILLAVVVSDGWWFLLFLY